MPEPNQSKTIAKTVRLLALLIIATAANTAAFAQPAADKIDHLITTLHERHMFNGTVMVVEDDHLVYEKALGRISAEGGELTLDHAFNLASVSKQFTAMAIMMLAEQEKLSYRDAITRFFPKLPYPDVTVRHLLNHTSGLPDYMELMEQHWDPSETDPYKKETADNDDVIRMLSRLKPESNFAPGEAWEYSNTGYVLLASVVGKASGTSFIDYLADHIFKPLKMDHTVVYSRKLKNPVKKRVYGFRKVGSTFESNDLFYIDGMHGDGAIYSNLADLRRWDKALSAGKLVTAETWKQAMTPTALNNGDTHPYGFGWGLGEGESAGTMGHGGGWAGFRTYIHRNPKQKRAILILTNNSTTPADEVNEAIQHILDKKDYTIPKMSIAGHLAPILLEKGAKPAIAEYHRLKKTQQEIYDFSEHVLNNLGYHLLRRESRIDLALAVFQLNVEAYPDRPNPHDSLAEAHMIRGDIDKAIAGYRKVLELDPGNGNATKMLSELEKQTVKPES